MPKLTVTNSNGIITEIECEFGSNLRKVLLSYNQSPYTRLTGTVNCRGNGICATCGVFVDEKIKPVHWHDRLASKFSYPRLSCQITITQDLHIQIPKKLVWGDRRND